MFISRASEARTTSQYGCDLRKLYPWAGVVNTAGTTTGRWGCDWVTVKPGTVTNLHGHPLSETFLITAGIGVMSVDGEEAPVSCGDVIFLPPHSQHSIANPSSSVDLQFVTIYWKAQSAAAPGG